MASLESRLKKLKNGTAKWTDDDTSTAARLRRAAAAAGITEEKLKEREEEKKAEKRTKEAAKQREQESGGDWWENTKNFAGAAGKEFTKAYTELGKAGGNVLGEITGENDKIRQEQERAQQDELNLIKTAQRKLKDPDVSEEEKARWRSTVKKTVENSTSFSDADKFNTELAESVDPIKGAANVGRIGVDILSGGSLAALRGGKAAAAGAKGLSIGTKGMKTGKLVRGLDDVTMGTGKRIARQGAAGAALEGAYSPLGQYAEDGDIRLEDVLQDATFGAALGGAGGALDGALTKGARKAAKAKAVADEDEIASVGSGLPDLERDMMLEQQALDEVAGKLDPNVKLLGSGEDTARARLDEIKALKEAQRGGDIEATSYQNALPENVDEAGMPSTTTRSPEIDEVNTRIAEETAPIQQQIDELETVKAEIPDSKRYTEASKNIQKQWDAALKEAETLPPLRQEAFLRKTEERLAAAQDELDERWINKDQYISETDAKIAELRAQEDEIAQRGMDEIAEIESRQAALQSERQARVKNMTADDWRNLQREEKELEKELANIEYSKTLEVSNETGASLVQAAKDNPVIESKVVNSMDDALRDFDGYNEGARVGIVEGNLGTREIVMRRAGPAVAKTWDEKIVPGQQKRDFALHQDMKQLEQLAKGIGADRNRATKIFNALESEDFSGLDAQELAAANWFRGNLKRLADEQGLPEEARISGYITHLFKGAEKLAEAQQILASGKTKGGKALTPAQERKYRRVIYSSDPELLRLMRKNASGTVNNNYLKKRMGVEGYETDPFQAYMVYAKKAYTKIHLEEGLTELAEHKNLVDDSYRDYINETINSIKGVPGEQKRYQKMINNTLEKLSGGRLDANSFEAATRKTSQAIYRGTLQYNFGTALTNLQQMGNTFTELGSKHLVKGVAEAMGKIKSGDMSELHRMGVLEGSLSEALINDDTLLKNMVGRGLEKSDKVGWYMFQTVEEMNRATAYYAAKSKGLSKGMSEEEAAQYGARIARKTQFKFSEIDTPPALHGPIAKNLTQLLTFSIKQAEYLKRTAFSDEGMFVPTSGGKVKLSKEGSIKMARLLAGYTVIGGTIGQITGIGNIDYGDIAEGDFSSLGNVITENTPFYQNFASGDLPTSPLTSFIMGSSRGVGLANILSGKNEYDRETSRWEIAGDVAFDKAPGLFIPGGTQIKKSTQGITSGAKGYSETGAWYNPNEEGRVRFEVDGLYDKGMAAIFGQYNTQGGRDYVKEGLNSLSENESRTYESASPAKRDMYMTFFKSNDNFSETVKKEFKVKGGKQGLSDEITKLIKDGNPEKARRYADTWNAIVEESYAPVLDEYKGMIPDELMDKIEAQKISSTPKAFERRRKKK